MKPKYKFDLNLMGKKVIVTQELERRYEKDKRFWEPVNVAERRVGWIVGRSWVCNGYYDPGYSARSVIWNDDYEPPSFATTEKIPCLFVTYWPNQKPIKIPVDGFIEYTEENCKDISLVWKTPYSSSGYSSGITRMDYLEHASRWAKSENCKRDSKGRFVKCNSN